MTAKLLNHADHHRMGSPRNHRIAIVGARRRTDHASISRLVSNLHMRFGYLTIISGGCAGPDKWAEESARAIGIPVIVHLPDLPPAGSPRWQYTRAYYARNLKIAEDCDQMFAFVRDDRAGGTENAIAHALELGRLVTIVHPPDESGRVQYEELAPKRQAASQAQGQLFEEKI